MRHAALAFALGIALLAMPKPGLADTASARAIAQQASSAISLRQYGRALDLLGAAITADSSYEYAYYLRAFTYRLQGNYKRATSELDKAETLDASDPGIWIERGRIALAQDRYSDAETAFQKAASLASSDETRAHAYQGKAESESDLNRDRDALSDAKTALSYAPSDSSIMSDLANYAYAVDDFPQSKQWLYRAIVAAPKDPWSFTHLAIFFYSRRQYAESMDSLNKALALSPKSADVHNRRAIVYSAEGRYDAALSENRIARAATTEAWPLSTEAMIYWSRNDANRAIDVDSQAVARKLSSASYYRGLARLSTGNANGAVSDLARYVASQHWKSVYGAVYLSIAQRSAGSPAAADRTLANDAPWTGVAAWLKPARAYLQGAIPADAFFAESRKPDELITAKTIVALDLLSRHREMATAKSYLRWVRAHAQRNDEEYAIAGTILNSRS